MIPSFLFNLYQRLFRYDFVKICFIVGLSALLVVLPQSHMRLHAMAYIGQKIQSISVEGNRNISASDVRDLLRMREGATLSKELINGDIKSLYSNGSFSHISMYAEEQGNGVKIRIVVKERAKINEIDFRGLEELNRQEITDAIPLKTDEVFTEQKLSESVAILINKYREKGLFNAVIKAKVIENKEDFSVNVIFTVDEGEDIKIAKINLLGVRSIDPEDILSALELQEEGFISDGTFQEGTFEKDKDTILEYYKSRGYLDVELEEARWDIRWSNPLDQEDRVIVVNYKIKENDQYFYAGYDIVWDEKFFHPQTENGPPGDKALFTKDHIESYFEYTNSDTGSIFDNSKFQRDRGIINFLYSQQGYIFARVIPERTIIILNETSLQEKRMDPRQIAAKEKEIDYFNLDRLEEILKDNPEMAGKKFVHTKFVIAEGDKGYIENIIIKGNKKTLDKVIRREINILVQEGDLFDSAKVQRAREFVFNLGFFKEVNVDARPGSREGQMNLLIDVVEQPTGTISLGGGYGNLTGFSIFTEVSENNLNGTGQKLSGRVEFGPLRTAIEASWTEPWMFDVPWSLTLSAFYSSRQVRVPSIFSTQQSESSTFVRKALGPSIGLGHRFWINWGHYHRFSPIFSVASDPSSLVDDFVYLQVDQGWQLRNIFTNGIYFDNRDNVFNTTKGQRFEFSIDLVGSILGGGDHYIRYYPKYSYYWSPLDFTFYNLIRKNILRRWRVVFEHRVSMTFTQQTAPVYNSQDRDVNPYVEIDDRLFMGGYESLRGWLLNDPNFPAAWDKGGSHRVLYGTELRVPVEPSLFWLVLFFDAGALYQDKEQFVIGDNTNELLTKAIGESALVPENIRLGYFRYSWGFGFRLQIPILPLRIYLAKRLLWDEDRYWFVDHPRNNGFEFVFGIGDRRF